MSDVIDKAKSKPVSILLVDDEPNILSALKRLLRKDSYNVFTASGGEEGLNILAENNIDLIVSDMRMPNMDGAEFLKKAKDKDDKIIRILLTGYSDMQSTVSAINDAEIFRYVSKPWNDDDFRLTIKRGLELRFLESDRLRLERLANKQNLELLSLNKTLESKVEIRTKKLNDMMEELKSSSDAIKANYLYIIKTFSAITDMRGGHLEGHSRRVADNARKMASCLKLNDEDAQDLFFGSLLHDIGKIGLSDDLISKSHSLLTVSELEQNRKHAVWGEGLLLGMDKFSNVARIIRHHHEKYDGTGYPDSLSGEDIPVGARVLAVVNDYDSLRSGALFQKKYSKEEALKYLKIHRQSYYDPNIVNEFVAISTPKDEKDKKAFKTKKKIFTYQLKPGMVLAADLKTKEGMLLLARDLVLDKNIISRLINHEKKLQEVFTIRIRVSLMTP